MSDDEFSDLVARHPELASLARLFEQSPTHVRQEAIDAFVRLGRVYTARTPEQRLQMMEYMRDHVHEIAAKAAH